MNLVQQVVDALETNEQKARDGVGLLLFAIRFGTDQQTFEAIKRAYPDAQSLLTHALAAGGRTAEMLAVANPAAVRKSLENAGYAAGELERLGRTVGDGLAAAVDAAAHQRLRATIEQVTAG
jgi:hypothetical protein